MPYLVWAVMVAIGLLLAELDQRFIGRPLFGVILIAGIFAGLIMTSVSPFSFGGGGYYMEGVLVSGGSMLALIGYFLAIVSHFAFRRWAAHRRFERRY